MAGWTHSHMTTQGNAQVQPEITHPFLGHVGTETALLSLTTAFLWNDK